MIPKLEQLLPDARNRRERIREKTLDGLKTLFPIVGKDATIEINNLAVNEKSYSSNQQKDALLRGHTLYEPVKCTLTLKDKAGNVLDEKANHTILHLPFFTERHTFIVGGNEYDVPSQLRLRSGVYTRERGNGEYEAAFNLSKGTNFRLSMEPESGKLHMELGTSKIPLYAVLKGLSVPDVDITRHWGAALRDVNAAAVGKKEGTLIDKVVTRIKAPKDPMPETIEGKRDLIHKFFDETEMDPEVTLRTLGIPLASANALALLTASKKLIQVHRGEAEEDDRDSLEFKTIHTVDDFFRERLTKDAARTIGRKLQMRLNMSKEKTLATIVPSSTFTKSLNTFLTNAALTSIPMQINPMEIIDHASRVTSLGEGGISSERAIPFESRKIHNTHLGILDPIRTPESSRAGVDIRHTISAARDDKGNLYTHMLDARTGQKTMISAVTAAKSTIGFSGQEEKAQVDAIRGIHTISVPRKEVDYFLPDPIYMLSPATALVPMINGAQGNRLIMSSKFQTQALSLIHRQAPLVQVAAPRKGRSMEQELARLVVPTSPISGTVEKIDADYIYIRPDGKTAASASTDAALIKIPYDTYFPLAAKTFLHNEVTVKPGDAVKADQILAGSNFTKGDALALGRNMSVAYMAYYGKNSNDAVVISDGAAKNLISEHMYKEVLPKSPDVIPGKAKYAVYYGAQFTGAQLAKLDANGVAIPGKKFVYGDPVLLALRKAPPSPEAALLGNFHKSLVKPYRDAAVLWEHATEGEVIDAVDAPRQAMITLKTLEPMKIGDKLANRFGGKGVVSTIVPDERMVKDEAGNPIDVMFTSACVISRINPAQIVEGALGKVAEKTGKPIILKQFALKDNVKYAKELLAEHGLKDKETVYDPVSGKHIPDIFVGRSFIHKLFKSTETNYSARGVADYDANMQPTRGGDDGAKAIGRMEFNALLAHNARNIIKDALTIKSDKSDEFWRALEFGLPPPPPKTPFAAEKLVAMLRGAGINLDKSGSQVSLGPLTDRDIMKLSSGALDVPDLDKSRSFMVNAKNLKPEKGGLFDPALTGGLSGTRWSHIELVEPIVNPIFMDSTCKLLGLTAAQLRAEISKVGGGGIKKQLNAIDLVAKEAELRKQTKTAKDTALDNTVKQLKYIAALREKGYTPGEAYTLTKIPVIPPIMRPILPSRRGGELQIADANHLYRDVGLASKALESGKEFLPADEIANARLHLHDATAALFGLDEPTSPQLRGKSVKGYIERIAGAGSPKAGFFHKNILKRQQDLSGRATAIPDASLNMDQVGVPEDMLWITYSKFIMRGLIGMGFAALRANEMIEERHPLARAVLDKELTTRPILLNRAPTLHKHNIIAAYPVPVAGKSLSVNPFIERSQNLDFDGDAMSLHVPVSDAAVAEAREMTISKLLFSDRNRTNLLVYPQHETIIGTFLATSGTPKGQTRKFKTKADAVAAYKKGEINLDTPVIIG